MLLVASTLTLGPTATAFATETTPVPTPDVAASSTDGDPATEVPLESSGAAEESTGDDEVTTTADTGADATATSAEQEPAQLADTGGNEAAKAAEPKNAEPPTAAKTETQTTQEVGSSSSEADIKLNDCLVTSDKDISNIEFFTNSGSLGKDESINSTSFDLTTFSRIDEVTRIRVKSGTTSKEFDGIDCGSDGAEGGRDDSTDAGGNVGDKDNAGNDNAGNDNAGNDNAGNDNAGGSNAPAKNDGTNGNGGGANSGDCAYVPDEDVPDHEPGTGKPEDGSVGNADDKCPPGQLPDGSDPNSGYECDENQGVGKGNPAHTGCEDDTVVDAELDVTIDKTNDADLDGRFTDSETARDAGQDVDFAAVITNDSEVAVVVRSLTDTFGGRTINVDCDETVLRTTIDPDGSVTCTFTVLDYAPSSGELDNTVRVVVSEVGNRSNQASAEDDSTVLAPSDEVDSIKAEVVKTNDADGDGTFTDSEVAPAEGATVEFQAIITNVGQAPVRIDSIVDMFSGRTEEVCDELLGTVLDPDESAPPCLFELEDYAPAPDESRRNRVVVDVSEVGDASNTDRATDTSLVTTAPVVRDAELSVIVDKTNDADGDTRFSNTERAPREGSDVTFRVEITNTSDVPVLIDSIVDRFPGRTMEVCRALIGDRLEASSSARTDDSVTCLFTVRDYAPAAGDRITNVVTVVVSDVVDDDNTATDRDSSTVSTPESGAGPELTVDVVKTNDADTDGTFTDSEEAATVGQDVSFEALITNSSAVDVEIESIVDRFNSRALPVCTDRWGDTIPANGSVLCEFEVEDYSVAGDITNNVRVVVSEPANEDNTAEDSDTSVVTAPVRDLRIVKVDDVAAGSSIEPGDELDYTITVVNDGDDPVAGFTVRDNLPAELSLSGEGARGEGFDCSDDEAIRCTYDGTLQPGDEVTITVSTTLSEEFEGTTVVNTATVPVVGDATPGNNTDTETTPVTGVLPEPPTDRLDLRIVKTDDVPTGGSVKPGDTLTYTLEVFNDGGAAVSGFVVTDTLPDELTLTSIGGQGFRCDDALAACTFDGSLPVGSSVTITVVTTVNQGVSAGTMLNTATVPLEGDPTPDNNTDTETTPVVEVLPNPPADRPDVAIVKDDAGASVRPGGQLTYTLTVTNQGTAAVSGLRVTDTLPRGLTLDSVDDSDGFRCMTSSTALDCTYSGSLAPEASAVLTVVTTLARNYTAGTVSNTAVVQPLPNETDTSDNTSTEDTPVVEVRDSVFDRPAPPADVDDAAVQGADGPDALPFTGAETDGMIAVAGLMLLVGVAAVLAGRRRPVAVPGYTG